MDAVDLDKHPVLDDTTEKQQADFDVVSRDMELQVHPDGILHLSDTTAHRHQWASTSTHRAQHILPGCSFHSCSINIQMHSESKQA